MRVLLTFLKFLKESVSGCHTASSVTEPRVPGLLCLKTQHVSVWLSFNKTNSPHFEHLSGSLSRPSGWPRCPVVSPGAPNAPPDLSAQMLTGVTLRQKSQLCMLGVLVMHHSPSYFLSILRYILWHLKKKKKKRVGEQTGFNASPLASGSS